MSFGLLNLTFITIGAAALALPIIAHLLSKRNFDVVDWGAMQFLELRRSAKRKLQLEQLLLLLLRMALIALVALAFARPWAEGGFLTSFITAPPRDIIIVLDGSHSMGWEQKADTPHTAARQWVHHFLEELNPGDTVGLIDARDQSRSVIDPPTRDFSLVRQQIDKLPLPSGSSNLADSIAKAAQALQRSSNSSREIIVLTDGQARCWHADDENIWLRYDDLLSQSTVKPRIWAVNVANNQSTDRNNFSVDALQLSRELTAIRYPIRVSTKVHYSGGTEPVNRRIYLEVDGQRVAEKTTQLRLHPNGEASIEFEHRFNTPGSHIISVVLDRDNLPGDDRADAALEVSQAIPVLLVNGDPQLDPVRNETHFAQLALTPSSNPTPWINANTVRWDQFRARDLIDKDALILANVIRLTEEQTTVIRQFVAAGGGLFIALGDKIDAAFYNESLFENGNGLLPASIKSIEQDQFAKLQGNRPVDSSLELPWLTRFRASNNGGFTDVRYTHWWKVLPAVPQNQIIRNDSNDNLPAAPKASAPVTAARLSTSDPLLITRNYGRGRVILMTAPLDADWSTFPTKHDYVSFLHEALFHLAAGKTIRNLNVGTPLLVPVPADLDIKNYAFYGPDATEHPPKSVIANGQRTFRMDNTILPGIYEFRSRQKSNADDEIAPHQYFVANFDRAESDLTPLGNTEIALLTEENRMAFIDTRKELAQQMHADGSRSELWQVLLLLFLIILVCEVLMTRHLVKGGHSIHTEEHPDHQQPEQQNETKHESLETPQPALTPDS